MGSDAALAEPPPRCPVPRSPTDAGRVPARRRGGDRPSGAAAGTRRHTPRLHLRDDLVARALRDVRRAPPDPLPDGLPGRRLCRLRPADMSGRIVVCGAVAQKPGQAGHTWQFLQYLLGFRRLGWQVLLVDRLNGAVAEDDARVGYLRT